MELGRKTRPSVSLPFHRWNKHLHLEGRCEACGSVFKKPKGTKPPHCLQNPEGAQTPGDTAATLRLQAYPDQLQLALLCASHLPRCLFHPQNLHQSQIHRNLLCPVSTNQSLPGWPTPLPSSCFEAAYNHSRQGRWVMWSGGFRVTSSHSASAATPPWPQPLCLYRKQWLPHLAREPLPSSARLRSLFGPQSAQCRMAVPGTTGTQRRASQVRRQS